MVNKIKKEDWELNIKSGVVLTDVERKLLEAVANKYEKDFIPFLETLAMRMPARSMPRRIQRDLDTMVKYVANFIVKVRVISSSWDILDKEDLESLVESRAYIEGKIGSFKDLAFQNQKFKEIVEELTKQTGVDFEKMGTIHATVSARLGEVGKRSFEEKVEGFGAKHPELYGTASALGKSALGVLGPYGQAISSIGSTIMGYRRRARQVKISRETGSLANQLTPENASPKEQEKIRKDLRSGQETGETTKPEDLYEYSTKKKSMGLGEKIFNFGKEKLENAGVGLFNFFNVGWKKAFWTKRILELLGEEKGKEEGKDKSGGVFDKITNLFNGLKGLLPMLGNILKMAGPVLAIAGAAFAGWQTGRLIGEKLGVDKVWQEGVAANATSVQREEQIRGAKTVEQKATIRLGDRQQELMKSGLSQVDAMTQAKLELGGQLGVGKSPIEGVNEKSILKPLVEKNMETNVFDSENIIQKNFQSFSKVTTDMNLELSKNTKEMTLGMEEMLKEMKSSGRKTIAIVYGEPDEISALNKGNLEVN
jgi:hypothetical protein